MTCDRNCDKCAYGVPVTKTKCGNPNLTCASECNRCPYSQGTITQYYCMDLASTNPVKNLYYAKIGGKQ